jgi:cysteine desulfurase / selenocysteine lyase
VSAGERPRNPSGGSGLSGASGAPESPASADFSAPGFGGPGGPNGASGLPEELRFALGFLPSAGSLPTLATNAPTGHVPTFGATSGVTRVPSAPTTPDWDPAQLGQVMLKMANDLFGNAPVEHGSAPTEHSTAYPSAVLAPSALAALPAAAFAPVTPEWERAPMEQRTQSSGVPSGTSAQQRQRGTGASAQGISPQLTSAPQEQGTSAANAPQPAAHGAPSQTAGQSPYAQPSSSQAGQSSYAQPSSSQTSAHGAPSHASPPSHNAAPRPTATSSASAPSQPPSPSPSPSQSSSALPWLHGESPGASPFSAPLDVQALFAAMEPPPPMSLPFLDHSAASSPGSQDTTSPYWLAAAPQPPTGATELTLPFDLASDSFGLAPSQPAPSAPAAAPTVASNEPALARRSSAGEPFDPHALRRQFPILQERVHGKPLVWLDNAATTQKPQAVIDRLAYFYAHENSNIHRAAHSLAARATEAYERSRESVRRFLGAGSTEEIIFVRGATEGINLIANSWGRKFLGEGDEILLTHLEHHANIVPWQQLAAICGARLRVAPVDNTGQILLEEYDRLLGPRTRLVAMTHVSNALGTITPARQMIELAHRRGAKVLLDGAQAVSHLRVDVQALDCDFYVFSGHKVFAPTGIGAVYAKRAILDDMPPWQGGGNMIADVTFEKTTYQPPPFRFEAGTGNIADAVGLGAALDWLTSVGIDNVDRYEHDLTAYATEELATVPGLTMIGTATEKAGVLSFILDGQHTQSVGGLLDREGIAVRSGHHCAQPILRRFGLEATVRASLAPYNVRADIDTLVDALHRLQANR